LSQLNLDNVQLQDTIQILKDESLRIDC